MPDLAELNLRINSEQAAQAAKNLNQLTVAGAKAEQQGRTLERAYLATGTSMDKVAATAARAMRAMSAGIGAATAAATAAERQWLNLGASILVSFAAGGPIAGGLSIVGAAIGFLTSETREAKEAAEAAKRAHEDWLKTSRDLAAAYLKEAKDLTDQLFLLRNPKGGQDILDLSQAIKDLDAADAKIQKLETEWRHLQMFGRGNGIRSGGVIIDDLDVAERERKAAQERLTALRAVQIERQRQDREAAQAKEDERERLEILKEEAAAIRRQREEYEDLRDVAKEVFQTQADVLRARLARQQAGFAAGLSQARSNMDQELTVLRETLAHEERLASIRGALGGAGRPGEQSLENEIRLLQRKRDLLQQIVNSTPTVGAADKELAATDAALKKAQDLLKTQQGINDVLDQRANRSLLREIELLNAANDEARERLRLEHRIQDLAEEGKDPALLNRLREATLAAQARERAEREQEEAKRLAEQAQQEALQRAQQLQQNVLNALQPLAQGITDLLMDGIENGFANGADIAKQIWRQMLANMIQEFVISGLMRLVSGALSGLGGGMGGGGRSGGGGILQAAVGAVGGFAGGGGGFGLGGTAASPIAPSVPLPIPGVGGGAGGGCAT